MDRRGRRTRRGSRTGWVVLLALLAWSGPAAASDAGADSPDWAALAAERLPLLAPCTLAGVDETALCGTLEVAEDRSKPDGRRIGLHVEVLPAHAAHPPSDPITVFAGGPGGAATGRAAGLSHVERLRSRDILLVDQRGTGQSHPLDCDFGPEGSTETTALPEMFPPAAVRTCAEELSRDADLNRYTTADHADDIEEVRRRLGYGPLDLRGGSYGTNAAMVFAQRHPESTRTLFLIGVDSPLRSNLAERSVWAEHTLAGLALVCAADEACSPMAPATGAGKSAGLDRKLTDLFDRLDAHPRRVEVADPERPDEILTLDVGRDWLAEQVRLLLYYGFTSRALPWAVHRAHDEDDWAPITRLALFIDRMFRSTLAEGVLLSVQCTEHMGFDTERALARGASTLFGNYRLAQQIQGCAAWPHQVDDRILGVARPRPLTIPTLLLSGAWDPVTPPAYAEDATAYFPNDLHLVLAEGQHGPFDLEGGWVCVHRIWADLIESGTVRGLDTRCADDLHRQPFLTDQAAFTGYLEGKLVPLIRK